MNNLYRHGNQSQRTPKRRDFMIINENGHEQLV